MRGWGRQDFYILTDIDHVAIFKKTLFNLNKDYCVAIFPRATTTLKLCLSILGSVVQSWVSLTLD